MLATEPLAQPTGCVSIDGGIGGANLPQYEIVSPSSYYPVEAFYYLVRFELSAFSCRHFTDPLAYALDACRVWARSNIGSSRVPSVVASNSIPKVFQWFLGYL